MDNSVSIHHVEEHGKGGRTTLENGAPVHKDCHPKGSKAAEFAELWQKSKRTNNLVTASEKNDDDTDDDE